MLLGPGYFLVITIFDFFLPFFNFFKKICKKALFFRFKPFMIFFTSFLLGFVALKQSGPYLFYITLLMNFFIERHAFYHDLKKLIITLI